MKLFELYESPILSGANNLKNIATAVANSSSAEIDLAGEPVTLEYPEARYVYGLYKQALKDGRQEVFMQMLSDPRSFDRIMSTMGNMLYRDRSPEMAQAAAARIGQPGVQEDAALATPDQPAENTNTLKYIVKRFPKEVKDFMAGGDLDEHEHLYDALFDYYMMHGEMPYGIAKARTGDPVQWISDRFEKDVQPYLHLHESLTEGKKAVAERWDDEDEDWWGLKDKKTSKTSAGGTVTQTGTGVIHKGKYGSEYQGDDGDEDDYDEWGNLKPAAKKAKAAAKVAKAAEQPKRSRGRPSAAIKSGEGGESISDYSTWYRKSKRQHPERKIVGSAAKAVAVVPKGKKFALVGSWGGSSGSIMAKAGELMTADQLSGYKSAKGRPKKVREFIENLRYVVEAKSHMGETEYTTYSGWKAACRKAGATEFDGDRDICQAKKDGKGVGEWDGAVGTVYDDAHKKAKK
jgi:hypothetical protein